jgi:hypothetical protein
MELRQIGKAKLPPIGRASPEKLGALSKAGDLAPPNPERYLG